MLWDIRVYRVRGGSDEGRSGVSVTDRVHNPTEPVGKQGEGLEEEQEPITNQP